MLVSNAVLLFNLFIFTPDSQSFHTKEPYLCVSIRHLKINLFFLIFLEKIITRCRAHAPRERTQVVYALIQSYSLVSSFSGI